jgi:hypothetical protein
LSIGGYPLDPQSRANPCGLIAKAFFNDRYQLYNTNGSSIFINETGIANKFDVDYMYQRDENYTYTQWVDVQDEHFIIWMRMETFPFFKKLWGTVEKDIPAGNYTFYIQNSKI